MFVAVPLAPAGAAGDCLAAVDDRCEVWVATYDDPLNGQDTPNSPNQSTQSLVVDPSGERIYITGSAWGGAPAEGGSQYDYTTIAYDRTGNQLWNARYNSPGNSSDNPWAIGVSPDGSRVFVTGGSHNGAPGHWDFGTVAYDALTGQQLWTTRHDATTSDRAWSLAVSPDGSQVVVAGDSGQNYAAAAYDAATGDEQWFTTYDGGAGWDLARKVDYSPDSSSVFLTGESPGTGTSNDFATVALDAANGGQRWVARFNGPANGSDSAFWLAAAPGGGSVFVTGSSVTTASPSANHDYVTIAYDPQTGQQQWRSRFDGPAAAFDVPLALAVAHDGKKLFVTGYSTGSGTSYDYATVAYEAGTGIQRWTSRYNGPAQNDSDIGYAVAVSPNDRMVYVTGASPPNTEGDNWDIATVGYSASTGDRQWLSRFNGPESFQDQAYAIAVSPDGQRIYVNGETWHNTSPGVGDFALLAYDISSDAPTSTCGVDPEEQRLFLHSAGSRINQLDALANGGATFDGTPPRTNDQSTGLASDVLGASSWTGSLGMDVDALTVDFWQKQFLPQEAPLSNILYEITVDHSDGSIQLPSFEVPAGSDPLPQRITRTFPLSLPPGEVTVSVTTSSDEGRPGSAILYDSTDYPSSLLICDAAN